jgi:hypothetical protein
MRNAPEVVREVGVDDVRVATEHQLPHLFDCLLGVSPRTVGFPPARVRISSRRIQFHRLGYTGPKSSSNVDHAVFIWDAAAPNADAEVSWFDRADYATSGDVKIAA